MILKDKTSWIRLLFSIRGSVLKRIWPRILVVTLFAAATTTVELRWPLPSLTPLPFTLIGLALSIVLGFRNNESYGRFWEGRKLWGAMVNIARSFARQILTLTHRTDADPPDDGPLREFRREIVRRTIAYVHAVRHHLRGSCPDEDLALYLPGQDRAALAGHRNVPLAVQRQTAERLQQAWRRGWIHDFHITTLDAGLTEMMAIQGGCERIKATPIPFAYSELIHQIVGLYCFLLPLGIYETAGVMTPLAVALISFAFFGLDAIGDELEDPFGMDENDLPLTAISRTIEYNLLQLLGETPPREIPRPVDDVLM